MKGNITIVLDQDAIEEALTNYISEDELRADLSGKAIDIKLIAGRGENGLRAELSIRPKDSTPATTQDSAENDAEEETPAAKESKPEKVVDAPFDFDED